MIDEQRTLEIYGYTSDDLTKGSNKFVVRVCDECGRYTDVVFAEYNRQKYPDMCSFCSKSGERHPLFGKSPSKETRDKIGAGNKGKTRSVEHIEALRKANTGRSMSDQHKEKLRIISTGRVVSAETRRKQSVVRKGRTPSQACIVAARKSHRGHHLTDNHRAAISLANTGRETSMETRIKQSCAKQGILLEEWDGFVSRGEYCEKFDEACREKCREKYDRRCFVCGKTEEENKQRLSVHHVFKNKNAGCDDSELELIPLCVSCHSSSHSEPLYSMVLYILNDMGVLL